MHAVPRSLAAVSLLFCLVGCALRDDDLDELRRLCAKDAGVRIYRTVDVDGYYDGEKRSGVLEVLIRSDFDFIEFCDDKPILKTMLSEPGCGRYTRVPADSERCHSKVQQILEGSVGEPYASFRKDYCVEFELIEKPTARYFYQYDLDAWPAADGVGEFTRIYIWISDTRTSELMGDYTSYSFNSYPGRRAPKSCHHFSDIYPSFVDAKLVQRVLEHSGN